MTSWAVRIQGPGAIPMPSSTGMAQASTTASGGCARQTSMAVRPSAASATISNPEVAVNT